MEVATSVWNHSCKGRCSIWCNAEMHCASQRDVTFEIIDMKAWKHNVNPLTLSSSSGSLFFCASQLQSEFSVSAYPTTSREPVSPLDIQKNPKKLVLYWQISFSISHHLALRHSHAKLLNPFNLPLQNDFQLLSVMPEDILESQEIIRFVQNICLLTALYACFLF